MTTLGTSSDQEKKGTAPCWLCFVYDVHQTSWVSSHFCSSISPFLLLSSQFSTNILFELLGRRQQKTAVTIFIFPLGSVQNTFAFISCLHWAVCIHLWLLTSCVQTPSILSVQLFSWALLALPSLDGRSFLLRGIIRRRPFASTSF